LTSVDLRLRHDYEVEPDVELPADPSRVPQIEFGVTPVHTGPAVIVSVRPTSGQRWIGVFAANHSPPGVTGIFACPSPDQLCVVAGGQGYVVAADHPSRWSAIDVFPIVDVAFVADPPLLIVADLTGLMAYGTQGVVWRSARLSYDGIKLTDATSAQIRGHAWSAPRERWADFTVETATGRHRGGANPP
jgi:hypothetical protein